jgi:siroheme synthase
VRGLTCLREADVVLHDRLIDLHLLEEAKPAAEIISVGKELGEEDLQQEYIHWLMIQKAREGKDVCRLKGGDPFVFGRGGEEARVLSESGIPFEIVPGVTSATAVPAFAGIPVTHRHYAHSFMSSREAVHTILDPQSGARHQHLCRQAVRLLYSWACRASALSQRHLSRGIAGRRLLPPSFQEGHT